MRFLNVFLLGITCAWAYVPVDKEDILPSMLLEELADRMQKASGLPNLELNNPNSFGPRSLEEEQYDHLDYDLGDVPLQPSIRDQEYLKHSTLWGSKFNEGNSEERENHQTNSPSSAPGQAKSKNTLPAYCNPPNPCPVGFNGKDNCIEEFENTAAFSRRFQEEQDCMCDAEHMFDCPDNAEPFLDNSVDPLNDYEFNNFMRQQMQEIQGLSQNDLMARKYYKDEFMNPFLTGERLPVAAKKGNRAL